MGKMRGRKKKENYFSNILHSTVRKVKRLFLHEIEHFFNSYDIYIFLTFLTRTIYMYVNAKLYKQYVRIIFVWRWVFVCLFVYLCVCLYVKEEKSMEETHVNFLLKQSASYAFFLLYLFCFMLNFKIHFNLHNELVRTVSSNNGVKLRTLCN